MTARENAVRSTAQIVCIIDRSGSMSGLEPDTIEGYNALLARQAELGPTNVTTVLFDDRVETTFADVPAEQARLSRRTYYTRGCTALLDAMGGTLANARRRYDSMPEACRPDHVIVLVTTDGLENASREWSFERVASLVRSLQDDLGWEFLFFGANIDAIGTAKSVGIPMRHAAAFAATSAGVGQVFSDACSVMEGIRGSE